VVKQSQQTTAKISGCVIKINNQQQQSTATTFQSVSPISVIPLQQYHSICINTVRNINQNGGRFDQKRTAVKSALTRFETRLNKFNLETDDASELELRYNNCLQLLDQFEDIQLQIEDLGEDNDLENESQRDNFENHYYRVLGRASEIIKKQSKNIVDARNIQNSSIQSEHQSMPQIKLPEIKLPTFDGRFNAWSNFHDTFKSLVHHNNALSNIDKLQYLKAALSGEPARVIHAVAITDKNYDTAWKKLIDRYEDKEGIILKHIKSLFELPPVQKESFLSLRQLADDTSIHLEAIENLDDENHKLQDRLLIHLMCSKLDNRTNREWERHIINKKCPPVDMLVRFLIERAKLLEKTNVNKSVKNPNINCMVSTKNLVCPSCKGSHFLYHCEQFLNSSINNRISLVKKLNLCLNCLKANHYTNNCKWSGCRKCHKKHNTLLHLDQKSNDEPEAKISQSPRESNNSDQNLNSNIVSNHSCTNTISSQILLATVCLQVRDKSGQFRNCRALLDSGSQCNLISNGCCKKLGLKLTKINSAIIGILINANPKFNIKQTLI
jgi:hypothetical protein